MKNGMHRVNKLYLPILAFLVTQDAWAAGDTPVSQGLGYLITAMTGGTGIAIATLGVMVVGLLCLGHFLKWTALGYTVIGIAIIFGAGAIVHGISTLVLKS